jgi:hypothetical protein
MAVKSVCLALCLMELTTESLDLDMLKFIWKWIINVFVCNSLLVINVH